MENINDIVWSMNPENNSFRSVRSRMLEFAETLLESKGIEYVFETDDTLNSIEINTEARRDFYLIFKEALNNLAKYSKASNAKISVKKVGDFIKMLVEDDGLGFDANVVKRGNGLINMQQRAERNGGEISISPNGSGTTVMLLFPTHNHAISV